MPCSPENVYFHQLINYKVALVLAAWWKTTTRFFLVKIKWSRVSRDPWVTGQKSWPWSRDLYTFKVVVLIPRPTD